MNQQLAKLLKYYDERGGYTIEQITKLSGRASSTLKKYCRSLGISFSDYTPRSKK